MRTPNLVESEFTADLGLDRAAAKVHCFQNYLMIMFAKTIQCV